MKRKTLVQIGLILAAILFVAGVIASGYGRAVYFSAGVILFFLSLRLTMSYEEDDGRSQGYSRLERMITEAIDAREKEHSGAEGFTDDPSKFSPIQEAVPMKDLNLLVVFRNGVIKTYDVRLAMRKHDELKQLLVNEELFENVQVTLGGYRVDWDGGLAIPADEIWLHGTRYVSPAEAKKQEERSAEAPGKIAEQKPEVTREQKENPFPAKERQEENTPPADKTAEKERMQTEEKKTEKATEDTASDTK